MKPVNKKILKTTVILFGAILLLWTVRAVYYAWQANEWFRKTDMLTALFEAPFRADTYGGKTPEETWNLYVEAIKKRDINLASKYYHVERQYKQKDYLQEVMGEGLWDSYIDDLVKNSLQKSTNTPGYLAAQKDRAYYFYNWKDDETGKIVRSDVNFYLNPYTNVWKMLY